MRRYRYLLLAAVAAAVLLVPLAASAAGTGTVSTFAGGGSDYSDFGDGGPASSATFNGGIGGITTDAQGNILLGDYGGGLVRVIARSASNPGYVLSTGCPSACTTSGVTWTVGDIYSIAGIGDGGSYSGDGGPATSAGLSFPYGVAVDPEGDVVVADSGNARLRIVAVAAANPGYICSPSCAGAAWVAGDIYTVAGDGTAGPSGDGASALSAELSVPEEAIVDDGGNLLIADGANSAVRLVAVESSNPGYTCSPSCSGASWVVGDIYRIAGNGVTAFAGDGGPALSAGFSFANSLVFDTDHNLLIADYFDQRVRILARSASNPGYTCSPSCSGAAWVPGDVYTIAGAGTSGYSGDGGPAVNAEFSQTISVALDAVGDVVIADTNDVVRVVAVAATNPGYTLSTGCPAACTTTGVTWTVGDVYTIAGTGSSGYTGDGGPAVNATFSLNGTGFARLDETGSVYVADSDNAVVRVIRNLDAPTGVSATPGSGSVVVGYGAVTGATSYRVFAATSSGGEAYGSAASCTSSTTSCTLSGLAAGTTYYVTVEAVNALGHSDPSTEASGTTAASSGGGGGGGGGGGSSGGGGGGSSGGGSSSSGPSPSGGGTVDRTPPSALVPPPPGVPEVRLVVEPGGIVHAALALAWTSATDNVGVDHYVLRINGIVVRTIPASATSLTLSTFSATGRHNGKRSTFELAAVDAAGNEGEPLAVTLIAKPRPKGLPRTIPAWAFPLLRWQQTRHGLRPAAAPDRLPAWYAHWAQWRLHPVTLVR